MKRILGIFILLLVVYLGTWVLSDLMTGRNAFFSAFNQENLLRRTALFGILGIGVAFVIITGGIDLSLGSVVCLVGVGFPWMVIELGWPLWVALTVITVVPVLIGLAHGWLVTGLKLQPFVVTLCGLLIYRGITRGFTNDQTAGLQNELKGLRWLATGEIQLIGKFGLPVPCVILIIVAIAAGIFLNKTIYGRYLLAMGNNEEAARFSGINTKKMTIIAYVISSALAGLAGLLFVLDTNSAQPVDYGNFYELFAIAAAVLGGCSLRGGTGTIVGVIIGTALIQVLRNMITLVDWINNNIEYAVIGFVILAGAIGDEIAKKVIANRRAASS
ncbi:MAG: ABC transporter permease [Verrucomicrobiota bacterium]